MSYDTLPSPIKCMCASFLRRIGGVDGGLGNRVQTEDRDWGAGRQRVVRDFMLGAGPLTVVNQISAVIFALLELAISVTKQHWGHYG